MATQKQIAEHLDLSGRHVRSLLSDGKLPPSKGRGGYDLDACRLAYIRYLRGVGTGQVNSNDDDDDDYSRLLEKEKYREKKRQNDIEESKVAPVDLLTSALYTAVNQIIPILESLPLVMKRNFPELSGDQISLVKKAVAECRNIIAASELKVE